MGCTIGVPVHEAVQERPVECMQAAPKTERNVQWSPCRLQGRRRALCTKGRRWVGHIPGSKSSAPMGRCEAEDSEAGVDDGAWAWGREPRARASPAEAQSSGGPSTTGSQRECLARAEHTRPISSARSTWARAAWLASPVEALGITPARTTPVGAGASACAPCAACPGLQTAWSCCSRPRRMPEKQLKAADCRHGAKSRVLEAASAASGAATR